VLSAVGTNIKWVIFNHRFNDVDRYQDDIEKNVLQLPIYELVLDDLTWKHSRAAL
jgi:hypothetical protein